MARQDRDKSQYQRFDDTSTSEATYQKYINGGFRLARLHCMRLEPLQDIEVKNSHFSSTGKAPQFLLHSSVGHLPSGWVDISFDASSSERWLHPTLYVDTGAGFAAENAICLGHPVRITTLLARTNNDGSSTSHIARSTPDVRLHFLVTLPSHVRTLRLDPVSRPGSFVLQDLRFQEIGAVRLAWETLRHHLISVWRQPWLLRRMLNAAWRSLRSEGIRGLRPYFVLAGQTKPGEYEQWVRSYDTLTAEDRKAIHAHVARLPHKPLLSVLLTVDDLPDATLRQALRSIRQQLYNNWELCIVDNASTAQHISRILAEAQASDSRIKVTRCQTKETSATARNKALALATGEYVAQLDPHDELAEHALYMVVAELNIHPHLTIIYSDEDRLSADGVRHDPYFKPDWNPDLFCTHNMIGAFVAYRTAVVRDLRGFRREYDGSEEWDLALRIVTASSPLQIRHLPHVLYHKRSISMPGGKTTASEETVIRSQARLLTDHLRHIPGATVSRTVDGHWRVHYPLPEPPPLVSVIIPTRNRVDLLARCFDSIKEKTAYPHFEIVIVDNQSDDPDTLRYLERIVQDQRAMVLRYDAPFNFSALNNFAVRHARGDIIGFLNNDVEVISPRWLDEMVSHAVRPDIGAVGAMLYYPDDTVQHAGVVLGVRGIANHAYSFQPRGTNGQRGRAQLQQNLSAVTAACLVVRRAVFIEVGGFDEVHLPVLFNDVDLCLRLGDKGYRTLWTPYAELYHYESASRGYDETHEKQGRFRREIDYMLKRWGDRVQNDPAYNVNLTLDRPDFSLAFPPRAQKPWRS